MTKGCKHIIFSLITSLWVSMSFAHGNDLCRTIDECLEELNRQAKHFGTSYGSLSKTQSDFVDHLVELGDPLVDRVIPLLEDPDEGVATLAAAILRDIERIDQKYLPQIVEGLDRGIGWLPPALARIGSPEAAEEAVKRFLVSESAPHNQEAYAIELFGAKAVPYIVKAVSCDYGCQGDTQYLLAALLVDMDDETKALVAKALIKVVIDKHTLDDISRAMLSMYWQIGPAGIGAEKELLQLKKDKPQLDEQIDYALVGIGSNYAGKIFREALHKNPSAELLDRVASRGSAAYDAGPEVMRLLNHPDLEIRLKAAETLGAIGYTESADKLVPLLWDPVDVRLNYVAAVSLGKLRAKSYSEALRKTADKHWYPPVRKAAEEAIRKIHSEAETVKNAGVETLLFGYFEEIASCETITLKEIVEPSETKLYKSSSLEKLKKLSFKTEVLGYTAADEAEQIAEAESKGETVMVNVTSDNMMEVRTPIEEVPDVALRVQDGWLAGSDRGEWGGDLVFIGYNSESQKILSGNIEDIFLLGEKYIAVTGVAHMVLNNGMIYEIYMGSDKKWAAKPWRALPRAPARSWFVSTGELFIDTLYGGSLLLSDRGEFRMAECVYTQ